MNSGELYTIKRGASLKYLNCKKPGGAVIPGAPTSSSAIGNNPADEDVGAPTKRPTFDYYFTCSSESTNTITSKLRSSALL